MNKFAGHLLEAFVADILAERDDPITRSVVKKVRERFRKDPRTMTGPIQTALDKSNKVLTDKPVARKKRK